MGRLQLRSYPETGTITLQNGDELPINRGGTFLRVASADQTFKILFDDDVQVTARLNSEYKFKDTEKFKKIVVLNDSGSSLTFQLDIGYGEVSTNNLVIDGTVKTAGGATRVHDNTAVAIAATKLLDQNNDRTGWYVYNNGTVPMFIGSDNTVTIANGTPIPVGGGLGGDDTDEVWAISTVAAEDARHWEAS